MGRRRYGRAAGTLARSVGAQPLLLIGAFRSDELPRGHSIRRLRSELRRTGQLRQLTVEPLDADASNDLLERTLGPVAPSLGRAVFERTDGVPFFVRELGAAVFAQPTRCSPPHSYASRA
jgi:predicted ATPase